LDDESLFKVLENVGGGNYEKRIIWELIKIKIQKTKIYCKKE